MAVLRKASVPLLLALFGVVVFGSLSHSQARVSSPAVVAFVHASVVPMDSERVLRDYTVVVKHGAIVGIGPATTVKVPAGALRIDASGRYLLPALCDMHVHLVSAAWNIMQRPEVRVPQEKLPVEDFLLPYVANGVTTVQALSATPEDIELRKRIERGEVLGPRLILARMIDGPKVAWPPPLSTWVDTPAEAREAVRQARAAGYDKIKVYSFLSEECYDAIVTTARELKMDVIGHVPMSVSVEHVLDSRQKLIAHSEELAKHARGDYSARTIDSVATLMADHGVWMSPTLMTTRSFVKFFQSPESLTARPEVAYFRHPLERDVWSYLMTNLYQPIPEKARDKIRDDFEKFQLPLTKAFHDKGGRLMTGSDALMIGVVPGFALQRELRELVDAGLTPYEALRTSTTNPFEYLGERDRAGTIAVGQHSDLLLLSGDPLEDISAASRIEGVLIRGRWLGAQDLGDRMKALASAYGTPGSRAPGGSR